MIWQHDGKNVVLAQETCYPEAKSTTQSLAMDYSGNGRRLHDTDRLLPEGEVQQ